MARSSSVEKLVDVLQVSHRGNFLRVRFHGNLPRRKFSRTSLREVPLECRDRNLPNSATATTSSTTTNAWHPRRPLGARPKRAKMYINPKTARKPMDSSTPKFVVEGNDANDWFWPLTWQTSLVRETYKKWIAGCGQGGSPTQTTHSAPIFYGGWWYVAHVNGEGSYLENLTLASRRRIHFLPQHDGRR